MLSMLTGSIALACGGFFCNTEPIDQAGENIVFAVEDDGTIESHVQIFYDGAAEDFAWVVPTPTKPELDVSTEALFDLLDRTLSPRFIPDFETDHACDWSDVLGDDDDDDDDDDDSVDVVEARRVGPYESVTLQASDAATLVEWLQDHDYDVPDSYETVVAPYVTAGSYFVALRLQSDKSVGDIAPIKLRYAGEVPMVPIQLTSIAAQPDMRIRVHILGDARAVPDNYLHVVVNEARYDWNRGMTSYDSLVTEAADEAGGQAFATDASIETERLQGRLWSPDRYDLDGLAGIEDPLAFMRELRRQFRGDDELLELLRIHMPLPATVSDGVRDVDFYDCLWCFEEAWQQVEFDPVAFAEDLEEVIVKPRREADRMLSRHRHITRLSSSMSPAEMTIDPRFVFNPDMGEVAPARRAHVTLMCAVSGGDPFEAPLLVDLEDGRSFLVTDDLATDRGAPAAARIERTSSSGQPEVLYDVRDDASTPVRIDDSRGCNVTPVAPLWLAVFGLLGLRRRASEANA